MNKITEKTAIPLGLALAIFGGGAVWLTTLQLSIADSAEKLQKQEIAIVHISENLQEVKLSQVRIEEQLKFISNRMVRKRGD